MGPDGDRHAGDDLEGQVRISFHLQTAGRSTYPDEPARARKTGKQEGRDQHQKAVAGISYAADQRSDQDETDERSCRDEDGEGHAHQHEAECEDEVAQDERPEDTARCSSAPRKDPEMLIEDAATDGPKHEWEAFISTGERR